MFNISGPYAVGKDTMLNELLARFPQIAHRVRTVTTRPVSSAADPSYEGLTADEFAHRTARGRWIVNFQLSGSVAYGTSIDEIENASAKGLVSVHSIYAGPQGAGRLREVFGRDLFSVGLLASDGGLNDQLKVLRDRLLGRGRDDADTVEARLQHQIAPIEYVKKNPLVETGTGSMRVFDEVLVNETLDIAVERVLALFNTAMLEGARNEH